MNKKYQVKHVDLLILLSSSTAFCTSQFQLQPTVKLQGFADVSLCHSEKSWLQAACKQVAALPNSQCVKICKMQTNIYAVGI